MGTGVATLTLQTNDRANETRVVGPLNCKIQIFIEERPLNFLNLKAQLNTILLPLHNLH